MKIVSTFLPAQASTLVDRPAVVPAFDALVGKKSLVVGIAVGVKQGPDLAAVLVSAVGQEVIRRCGAHLDLNYPDGAVLLVEVKRVAHAVERVRKALAEAPEHALVLLLCADDKVYDAAFPALCVDFKSANQNAH